MQSAPALVGTPKFMMVGCAGGIITTTIVILLCQNWGSFTDNDGIGIE